MKARIDSLSEVGAATPTLWVVHCDFDGTISCQDVIDHLLARHGLPGWQCWEQAWARGEIGSALCLQQQVALLEMSATELRDSLAGITLDPGFVRFVAAMRADGVPVHIISDGLAQAIRLLLRRHGLAALPVAANRLRPAGARRWTLETPWSAPGCDSAHCKCRHQPPARASGRRVLYIGDGRSDYCPAARADFVFAKGGLREYCERHAIAYAPFADFDAVLAAWPAIRRSTARLRCERGGARVG